jgi:hypothetical protein
MPPLFFNLKLHNMEYQVWTNENNDGKVNNYEYDLVDLLGEVYLSRSNNPSWTKPGERVATMVDDGNGVTINFGSKKIAFGYDEQVQILALLLYNYKDKLQLRQNNLIKSI